MSEKLITSARASQQTVKYNSVRRESPSGSYCTAKPFYSYLMRCLSRDSLFVKHLCSCFPRGQGLAKCFLFFNWFYVIALCSIDDLIIIHENNMFSSEQQKIMGGCLLLMKHFSAARINEMYCIYKLFMMKGFILNKEYRKYAV